MRITVRGLSRQWPRTAADSRGNCCGWTSAKTAVEIAAGFRGLCDDCGVAVAMAADGRGKIAADFRGLRLLVLRSLPRTEPRHVTWPQPWHLPWKCYEPWHLPWKAANFHSGPWQHSQKSTEVPGSLPRTAAKKSSNVHPCTSERWLLTPSPFGE